MVILCSRWVHIIIRKLYESRVTRRVRTIISWYFVHNFFIAATDTVTAGKRYINNMHAQVLIFYDRVTRFPAHMRVQYHSARTSSRCVCPGANTFSTFPRPAWRTYNVNCLRRAQASINLCVSWIHGASNAMFHMYRIMNTPPRRNVGRWELAVIVTHASLLAMPL